MAATIDHLRADHHVEVLKDFTDARGVSHRVGETGVIRSMGLDTTTMELWIDWERMGAVERLWFGLRAQTGPGNGRMREYFALGSEVVEVAVSPPPLAAASPPAPKRTVAVVGAHPPAGTNLGEVAVACDCEPSFHRNVLASGTGVHACLRCGTVTYTHPIGDDGRHTGNAWTAFIVEEVSDVLARWLARWPRVHIRHHDLSGWLRPAGLRRDVTVYLPAALRCETVSELAAAEAARPGGVEGCAFPSQAPPVALPPRLLPFAQFATAVRLTPHSDVADLLASADPQNAACALAVSKLMSRADAYEVMVTALRHDDPAWQGGGAAMACAARPFDPRLPSVLLEILTALPIVPHARVPDRIAGTARWSELLAVIAAHPVDTPEIRATLPRLQRAVAGVDVELAGRIGHVLRVLHGLPTPRVGFPF
jgi:hypothetical protein